MELETLRRQVAALEDWVIGVRRELHRHPELGLEERWTAGYIAEQLDALAIPYQTGVAGTGIVGLIRGGHSGKTVALRADMDALPITEQTGLAYASEAPGKMHACGHDAHLAILLGAARVLGSMARELTGNIKLLFQPAEETVGGAQRMIDAGCLEEPRVDYALGLHVTPAVRAGQILMRYGKVTASSDDLVIVTQGRAAHAAYPEAGVDAVVLAASVVLGLQTVIARNLSPLDSAVISLGRIEGGSRENILAERVEMRGTLRTLTPETRMVLQGKISELAAGICSAMGGTCTVEFHPGYAPVINDDAVSGVVDVNARKILGAENVIYKEFPSLGVEDFGCFAACVPSAFYYLGAGNPDQGIVFPAHSPQFQIDESCLATGILLQVVHALTLLEGV